MSLQTQIQEDMKAAMKRRESETVSTLRMLVSSLQYAAIDAHGDLSDDAVVAVMRREAKKRREAIDAYELGNRTEQAQKERDELAIIESYLPAMMDEDAIRAAAHDILSQGSFASVGEAIGAVMAELKGKADGSVVSSIVKEFYSP